MKQKRKRLYFLIDFSPAQCRPARPSDRIASLASRDLRSSGNKEDRAIAGSVLSMRVKTNPYRLSR